MFGAKVVHGNADMSKARELCPDHPEVVIYHKRCLGAAEELFAKATATADAGDDRAAVKVLFFREDSFGQVPLATPL